MMPGVNYVIYGCSSVRTTPGVSLYRSLTLEEKFTTFTHPLSSVYIARVINFQFSLGKQFFSWLGRFIYKLG